MRRLSSELDLINRFRRRAPVDVEGLSASLGVPVRYVPLDDDLSGLIEPTLDGGFRIVVNDNHAPTRQRFTIAHELAHYILHRHLIGSGLGDDRAYRSAHTGMYRNTQIGKQQETEANRLAASILMPQTLIDDLSSKGHNSPESLAAELDVSVRAMEIRMGEDGRHDI